MTTVNGYGSNLTQQEVTQLLPQANKFFQQAVQQKNIASIKKHFSAQKSLTAAQKIINFYTGQSAERPTNNEVVQVYKILVKKIQKQKSGQTQRVPKQNGSKRQNGNHKKPGSKIGKQLATWGTIGALTLGAAIFGPDACSDSTPKTPKNEDGISANETPGQKDKGEVNTNTNPKTQETPKDDQPSGDDPNVAKVKKALAEVQGDNNKLINEWFAKVGSKVKGNLSDAEYIDAITSNATLIASIEAKDGSENRFYELNNGAIALINIDSKNEKAYFFRTKKDMDPKSANQRSSQLLIELSNVTDLASISKLAQKEKKSREVNLTEQEEISNQNEVQRNQENKESQKLQKMVDEMLELDGYTVSRISPRSKPVKDLSFDKVDFMLKDNNGKEYQARLMKVPGTIYHDFTVNINGKGYGYDKLDGIPEQMLKALIAASPDEDGEKVNKNQEVQGSDGPDFNPLDRNMIKKAKVISAWKESKPAITPDPNKILSSGDGSTYKGIVVIDGHEFTVSSMSRYKYSDGTREKSYTEAISNETGEKWKRHGKSKIYKDVRSILKDKARSSLSTEKVQEILNSYQRLNDETAIRYYKIAMGFVKSNLPQGHKEFNIPVRSKDGSVGNIRISLAKDTKMQEAEDGQKIPKNPNTKLRIKFSTVKGLNLNKPNETKRSKVGLSTVFSKEVKWQDLPEATRTEVAKVLSSEF